EERHDGGRNRAHAGGERPRRLHAFERGNRLLSDGVCRISPPCVIAIGPGHPLLLIVVGDFEGGRLVDGGGNRVVFFLPVRRAVYRSSVRRALVLFHGYLAGSRVIARFESGKPNGRSL